MSMSSETLKDHLMIPATTLESLLKAESNLTISQLLLSLVEPESKRVIDLFLQSNKPEQAHTLLKKIIAPLTAEQWFAVLTKCDHQQMNALDYWCQDCLAQPKYQKNFNIFKLLTLKLSQAQQFELLTTPRQLRTLKLPPHSMLSLFQEKLTFLERKQVRAVIANQITQIVQYNHRLAPIIPRLLALETEEYPAIFKQVLITQQKMAQLFADLVKEDFTGYLNILGAVPATYRSKLLSLPVLKAIRKLQYHQNPQLFALLEGTRLLQAIQSLLQSGVDLSSHEFELLPQFFEGNQSYDIEKVFQQPKELLLNKKIEPYINCLVETLTTDQQQKLSHLCPEYIPYPAVWPPFFRPLSPPCQLGSPSAFNQYLSSPRAAKANYPEIKEDCFKPNRQWRAASLGPVKPVPKIEEASPTLLGTHFSKKK